LIRKCTQELAFLPLEKWTHLVTVEVRRKSFTDYPSKLMRISETIQLKVEPNASLEMVQWLVCKKLELEYPQLQFVALMMLKDFIA